MSEEQQMQVAKLVDKEQETKRVVAWGGFGKQLYHTEIALQLQAQDIIKQLITPTTPEQIKQAEQAIALVKKKRIELQDARKAVTNKFTPVINRLMLPEQQIDEAIKINENLIFQEKLKEKEAAKTKEAKAKELKLIAEHVRVYIADMHAAYLAAQLKTLSDAYEYALTNNITVEALPEFKAKVCARVNLKNRETPAPKPPFKYNTQEDIDAEVAKFFNPWPAQEYVDGFAADVELKFSDWEQALKDKPAAQELNKQEVATTTEAITQQKEKDTVAAHLESLAVSLAEDAGVKPLKEVWQIAEPENVDQMFAIVNAFAVNRHLVQEQMSKMKYVNFGVKQMIATLVAVKNADENFECTGIDFYKIEKL